MRLDVFLTQNGYCESRQRAKLLIEAGRVFVNGKTAVKAAFALDGSETVTVGEDPIGYVSRGALKLKAAIETFPVSVCGKVAADIGASTGGFTEVLLENGAAKVYAVDSGSGQLAEKLRKDPRVLCMEKYNARDLRLEDFDDGVELAVMDVSFISQTLILPSLCGILRGGGNLVSLIKPQFEAGREAVGKGGIVKSAVSRARAIRRVADAAAECGLILNDLAVSPIKGGDGNIEYLAYFTKSSESANTDENMDLRISRIVGL